MERFGFEEGYARVTELLRERLGGNLAAVAEALDKLLLGGCIDVADLRLCFDPVEFVFIVGGREGNGDRERLLGPRLEVEN